MPHQLYWLVVFMRENKYDKLLFASVALLVLSAVMLLISGYNIYFMQLLEKCLTCEIGTSGYKINKFVNIQHQSDKKKFSMIWNSCEIKSFPEDIPIIALSADAFIDTRRKVIEAGMNDFVTKPFKPDELYQKVLKYLLH